MSKPYAHNTTCSIESSRSDIVKLIERFEVGNLVTGRMSGRDFVMFEHSGNTYRFQINPLDDAKEERRQWRCMILYIKSALVSVREGFRDMDTVFLADRILPNGQSWGDYAKETNELPSANAFRLLEAGGEA